MTFVIVVVVIFVNNQGRIAKNVWINNSEDVHALEVSDSGESSLISNLEEGAGNEGDVLETTETDTSTTDTSKWDLAKVDIVYDTEGVAVPVPKGYVASGADGEHTVNTGFVIYEGDGEVTTENAWDESCIRNQWVWVPVPDPSRIYEIDSSGKKKAKLYSYSDTGRTVYTNSGYEPGVLNTSGYEKYFIMYGLQGMTEDELLEELQVEFEATIESIEKYGGFYIGRYETGGLRGKEPVVQRMKYGNDLINTWYYCYIVIKNMALNTNVKTNIIWGCLWDEVLQWLVDTGNKKYVDLVDSTSWGNYNNSEFEYITLNGTIAGKTAGANAQNVPTGSTEYTNSNNIYDLAGGREFDWTLECSTNSHQTRGGGFYTTGSNAPSNSRVRMSYSAQRCVRAYLYIK